MRSGVTARNIMNQQVQLERERQKGTIVIIEELPSEASLKYGLPLCLGHWDDIHDDDCPLECPHRVICLNMACFPLTDLVVILEEV